MGSPDTNGFLDFNHLHRLEYVEANGLGGFASGTMSGAHSRKYHGLLVASLKPPVQRVVVVSKIDETISLNNEYFDLGCNQFPGALHPQGFQFLHSYSRALFPEWIYTVKGVTIKKTIAAVYGQNTTLVLYEVLSAPGKFQFLLKPFYASRDMHHTAHANDHICQHYIFQKGTLQTMNYQGCPEFFISVPRSQFIDQPSWYHNFEFRQEQERGMDFQEDLYTHGHFEVTLRQGSRLGVIVSIENHEGKDAFKLLREEKKRRVSLLKPFNYHPSLQRLALSADQFIVKRDELNTIIAGYPWFTDWGRDTMISLPGLCLITGKVKEAKRILQKFSEYVSNGMIPNRFPDHGEEPEYNTVDATLWYFNALYKYYKSTSDKLFIKSLIPQLREIIDWHYKGTRFGIKVDPEDELLYAGQEGVQLTWMDAKIGDWVVTPRRGKAVEINALWYNAICVMRYFLRELNYPADAEFFEHKELLIKKNFNLAFWNEKTHSLYDYIEGDHRSEDIRPNQVYSMSLTFPVLDHNRAHSVMSVVREHLFTPYGLRSLSPAHSAYRACYVGNPFERDSIYHQGPVWSHLMGAYIDALFYTNGEYASRLAREIIENMFNHLDDAGLGSISEIFDAEPPFTPRGCISQAWSVAEILRVCVEYKLFPLAKNPRLSTESTTAFETV